jgi:hypothetical protein
MFSGEREYHKFDIARGQLETAIRLFLIDGADMFSALTLAGAAGEILHRLVLNDGKEPFVDSVIKVTELKSPKMPTPARSGIIKHIHDVLFVNHTKHLDKGQDVIVKFDAEEAALAAILKAMVDYKTLTGEHTQAMKAFLGWTYQNLDSSDIMKRYEEAKKQGKVPP